MGSDEERRKKNLEAVKRWRAKPENREKYNAYQRKVQKEAWAKGLSHKQRGSK